MRISDWSSDVCSSDLHGETVPAQRQQRLHALGVVARFLDADDALVRGKLGRGLGQHVAAGAPGHVVEHHRQLAVIGHGRSEEHTSELQSLMRISYAVFCLKKKKNKRHNKTTLDKIK